MVGPRALVAGNCVNMALRVQLSDRRPQTGPQTADLRPDLRPQTSDLAREPRRPPSSLILTVVADFRPAPPALARASARLRIRVHAALRLWFSKDRRRPRLTALPTHTTRRPPSVCVTPQRSSPRTGSPTPSGSATSCPACRSWWLWLFAAPSRPPSTGSSSLAGRQMCLSRSVVWLVSRLIFYSSLSPPPLLFPARPPAIPLSSLHLPSKRHHRPFDSHLRQADAGSARGRGGGGARYMHAGAVEARRCLLRTRQAARQRSQSCLKARHSETSMGGREQEEDGG